MTLEKLLTKREYEIAGLISEGLTDKQIATKVRLAANTVGVHLQHIYEKLRDAGHDVDNRVKLARLFIFENLR